MEIIKAAGGLHQFMNWGRPILTDSGGYQVFSLANLSKITDNGVEFRSHLDGAKMFLGPQEALDIQECLGSDIAMVFDDCPPYPCKKEDAEISLNRTLDWARQSRQSQKSSGQLHFAIVQGSAYKDLRKQSAKTLVNLEFDGYAIGGLSVGEPEEIMYDVIKWVVPELPYEKPRYLMGVGTPPQILRAISMGIDMFDCVLPTRVGRNGCAYTAEGMLQIKGGRYKKDFSPIEKSCSCYACQNFTKAYIRHLLNVGEILGLRLLTLHNLHFYQKLMENARRFITQNRFQSFLEKFLNHYSTPKK